jgi:hypothetical protein
MISVRYGVSSCCEVDVNKWDIKKQIVDFELITIPKEDEDLLGKYGYKLSLNHDERVKILNKASKDHSMLKILRHINALRTLHKSNDKYYNKLDKDLKWIQKNYNK